VNGFAARESSSAARVWALFKSQPNLGHEAIADFLGCGAIREAVTTNLDRLVENAADNLGEPLFRAIADVPGLGDTPEHRPYLKVYGCMERSPTATIWYKEQDNADARSTHSTPQCSGVA